MEPRKGSGMVIGASIFALLVVAVAGGTYFFENHGTFPFFSAITSSNPNDTDGDGLLTWEELAWHTDPNKADTDGDGASDGAEVTAGTNPTIAGAGGNPYESWSGYSPTESFARDIADAQIVYNSASTTPGARQAAAKSAVSGVQLPDLQEKIPMTALKIGTSTDARVYAGVVVTILRKSVGVRTDELSLFKQAIDTKNYTGTPALKETTTVYRSIEAALLAIDVPQAAAGAHITLVNDIGTLANITNAMGAWGGDPIAGLAYMDAYLKIAPKLQTDIADLFTIISTLLGA